MAVSVTGTTTDTTPTTNTNSSTTTSNSALGKDDFLKLLITQMQNQDPTKPQDDTQMIAQLAQFSSLEQMQNLNATAQMAQATTLIGKVVSWTDSSSGQLLYGQVSAVKVVNNQPKLIVGDYTVGLSDVSAVVNQTTQTNSTQTNSTQSNTTK
ncbi:MAG: flagellar hook capping FlgD N-terminal domain-containing protein [Sporomusaceae bacterium]|nr:flagellar hook capping FlgD N-terminal domain-containing protein [Sporomusaceae bacterium]